MGIGRHAPINIGVTRNGLYPDTNRGPGHFIKIAFHLKGYFRFMYFVYILYSEKCDRYYVGYAADIDARIIQHNSGFVTATKNCRPYKLCKSKSFATETEARKEEARIKKQKSRKHIESLILGNW